MFEARCEKRGIGAGFRARAGLSALGLALGFALLPVRAYAQAPAVHPSASRPGFGPDAQLTGGIGFGFEAKLDNLFLARVRLGGLYAKAPWVGSVGLTAEVGALAGLGLGGELELGHASGPYASVGVARVDDAHWMAHAGLGFMIFGFEWQHVFGPVAPRNALLLEVRLPLGLWWLQKREKRAAESAAEPPPPPKVLQRGPTAASGAAPATPLTAVGAGQAESAVAAASPAPDAGQAAEVELRIGEARQAHERADFVAEAIALSRAVSLRAQPALVLRLLAAELRLGKPRAAQADWQRLGDLSQLGAEERTQAEQLHTQMEATLAHLRVVFEGETTAADSVAIDGIAEPGATLGYDVALDPGPHKLQWSRAQRVLFERDLQAEPGALLRLNIPALAP